MIANHEAKQYCHIYWLTGTPNVNDYSDSENYIVWIYSFIKQTFIWISIPYFFWSLTIFFGKLPHIFDQWPFLLLMKPFVFIVCVLKIIGCEKVINALHKLMYAVATLILVDKNRYGDFNAISFNICLIWIGFDMMAAMCLWIIIVKCIFVLWKWYHIIIFTKWCSGIIQQFD